MRTLLLVDGNNVLYRAFFAIPDLSTRDGRPTNAVFGFIRLLRQMRDSWRPDHIVVAFDGGTPEDRKALLEGYKAQRKPMPERLKEQIPLVERYLDAARVSRLRIAGEEADDVIATLTVKWKNEFDSVLVASSDKDLFQLVDDRVRVAPVSGKGPAMGPADVELKTGVPPRLVRDWLAMVGDAADNIPGVPGVGPKTAARLLGEYGSVDGVYAHLDKMPPGRTRESLGASRELVQRNLLLMRLREGVNCGVELEGSRVAGEDRAAMLSLLEELEFTSLATEYRHDDLFAGV
jgi:DNA polymerase I